MVMKRNWRKVLLAVAQPPPGLRRARPALLPRRAPGPGRDPGPLPGPVHADARPAGHRRPALAPLFQHQWHQAPAGPLHPVAPPRLTAMSTHSATTGQIVLVCGATGRLAPLTPRLLSRGHQVLAATRDPASPAARRLRETGAHLIRADFADPASLRAAAVQASAVVAAGTAHAAGPAIIDAAHAARTGHLVYVTAAGASQPTGVPVIDSKHAVEQHLRDSGVPHTINRAGLLHGKRLEPVEPGSPG